MKHKLLGFVLTSAMCATMAFSLAACGDSGKGGGGGGGTKPTAPVAVKLKTTDVVGLSVSSTANILGSMGGTAASLAADPAAKPTPEQIALVKEKLQLVESFVGNPPTTVEGVSDKAEYAHMLKITTKDLAGKESVYVLYYNQLAPAPEDPNAGAAADGVTSPADTGTPPVTDAPVTPPALDVPLDSEQEFSLEGIMIIGEGATAKEYTLVGEKEISTKTEEGVTEKEFEMNMTATDTLGNKVIFTQEIEQEGTELEQKFSYQIFGKDNAGKEILTDSFSIEIEEEEGEQEINLQDGETLINFEKEVEKGKTYMVITITEAGVTTSMKVTANVDPTDATKVIYTYEFANGDTDTDVEDND
ncbi:MAG: hypothetical protein RR338_01820 [Clostridia bacterium]